jgi:hypothetical protein
VQGVEPVQGGLVANLRGERVRQQGGDLLPGRDEPGAAGLVVAVPAIRASNPSLATCSAWAKDWMNAFEAA